MNTKDKINLQLGDIIQIDAPTNLNYHNKIYYINYIDKSKIKIISDTNESTLLIDENGNFLEESIENFILLYRHETSSYIKQHNLNTNQKISIYFNFPEPYIINGIITNIEEDMLEIKINKTDEIIYIDFAYSGIPESLNIEKIVINNSSVNINNTIEDEEIIDNDESIDNNKLQKDKTSNIDNIKNIPDDDFDIINLDNNKKVVIDELDLDMELEEIYYSVNVSDNEKRFSLEDQIHDYLNYNINLLTPENKTDDKINLINKEINRFIELREIYSNYDENYNLKLPKLNDEFNKPLKDILLKLNKKIHWILPVTSSKKILFDKNDEIMDDDDFSIKEDYSLFIKKIDNCISKWTKNNSKDKINTYKQYINELYDLFDSTILKYNETSIVNSRIDVLNDIYDNFYSYCISKNNLNRNRFISDVYNEGLKMLEIDYLNGKKIFKKVNLTNNDKVKIISFITLPLPIMNFSNINSNYISISDKVNYNNNFFYNFKLLRDNTSVNKYFLENKDFDLYKNKHENIHNNNIFKSINNFQSENYNNDTSEYYDNLDNLIESFIPTNEIFIKTFFENYKIYNFTDLLFYLQSANIDYFNIHNNTFNIIKSNLNKNSENYKLSIIKNNENLKSLLEQINNKIKTNNINYNFDLLSKNLKDELFESYNISDNLFNNNEEFLNKVINIDNANFLYISLSKSVIDLVISNLLDSFIKQQEKLSKEQKDIDLNEDSSTCEKFVLSKKYNSIENLENDNNKLIFFDSIYDKTLYSFINDYEEEKNSMDNKQFINFLTNELMEKLNLTNEKAKREAKSITQEKREVINGDYALFINKQDNKNYIYVREDDIWKISDKFKENFYIDSNKIFCDINKKCISKNDKCNSIESIRNKYDKNDIDEILKSFDLKYNISIEELKGKVNEKYEYYKKILKKKIIINNFYNEKNNNIILKFNIPNNNGFIISPNENLRDRILAYPDIVKKNYYIRIFSKNLLRNPNSDEDKYWLYCSKTNIKILPIFILKLANCFDDKEKYLLELDTICAEQGTISDDNSFWVDKYSGYIIKRIDFNNDEGFDDSGFKLNTKEILEKDYIFNSDNNPITKESSMIYAIIKTMGNMIGINLSNHNEIINNNVLKILKKNMPTKEIYDKKIEALKKKDPKSKQIIDYDDFYNNLLLYLTLSYICIFIQTNIPSYTTKKTFPGCIKSFNGYPLNNQEDKTFLLYIACIANKIKSSIKPWNTIQKTSELNIQKKLEAIIKDYILIDSFFIDLIDKKKQYLIENKIEEIPDKISINSWTNFMPPLNDFKIKNSDIIPIDKNFTDTMIDSFKKGKKDLFLDIINSKIILISNYIISIIQDIVKKKTPLLETSNGEPYMENSCCNELNNTIQYFIQENKNIYDYNVLIKNYLTIISDIVLIEKPVLLFHDKNTKINIPKISNDYNEITIYRAFIYYCNFNNKFPIKNELKAICNNKPINIDYNLSIYEVIENIKSQGKIYGKVDMIQLIDTVNKNNIFSINYNDNIVNNIENLRNILENYKKNNLVKKFDEIFFNKLYDIIDKYDIANFKLEDTNDIKNYLYKINNLMKNNILNKLKKFSFISKKDYINFEKNLDFNLNEKNIYLFKNYLIDFIKVFPNIIKNKSINFSSIPKHWNLSKNVHEIDVYNIIKNYYEKYLNFDKINLLNIIFNHIEEKYNIFLEISKYFYFYKEIIISENKTIQSIFSIDLLLFIYQYIYLSLIEEYLNILDNSDIELQLIMEDQSYDKDIMNQILFTYLNNFINTFTNHNNMINDNYKKIKEKILFAKEKEKDIITDFLKNLTDEERNIETLFKNNKLGKWNKGLQKGITQYVKENYDEERKAMDKQAILEKKLNKKDIVTDMNKEIYIMDIEEEDNINKEIEDDEYDMSNIPDDDDPDTDYED